MQYTCPVTELPWQSKAVAATFEQRVADAIAELDLGELLALDTMLAAIEDPVEAVAAVSVFLSVFAR